MPVGSKAFSAIRAYAPFISPAPPGVGLFNFKIRKKASTLLIVKKRLNNACDDTGVVGGLDRRALDVLRAGVGQHVPELLF